MTVLSSHDSIRYANNVQHRHQMAAGSTLRDRLVGCDALRILTYGIHTRDIREMEAEAASLLCCESRRCLAASNSLRDTEPRVQVCAFRAKTPLETKPLRGLRPAPLGKTVYPDTGFWRTAWLFTGETIPAANAFGSGRSGFGISCHSPVCDHEGIRLGTAGLPPG